MPALCGVSAAFASPPLVERSGEVHYDPHSHWKISRNATSKAKSWELGMC